MSEPPGPATPPPEASPAARKAPHPVDPQRAKAMRTVKPTKDRAHLLAYLVPAFLFLMLVMFVYNYYVTSIPVRTETLPPPKPRMVSMDKLCNATSVKELSEDRWELMYDFEQAAALQKDETKAEALARLKKILKDWKGPRNSVDAIRHDRKPEHDPIVLTPALLPRTHLISQISFQGGGEVEVELEPGRAGTLWVLFYYFYEGESTGTALKISVEHGTAQFVRYRRDIFFDEPRGTPASRPIEHGQRLKLRVAVEANPLNQGYSAKAYLDGTFLTEAAFPPEWPEDRRYDRGESRSLLVADNPVPPRAGFVAVASDPVSAATVYKIAMRGTVAESWRAERTRRYDVLKEYERDAQILQEQERQNEPAEPPAPAPAKTSE
ncbi:MAG: hypothetical protein KIS92_13040 [Planctomycetota bacterium]|nr:hypothetical protein [Planctomycetota bacterium]